MEADALTMEADALALQGIAKLSLLRINEMLYLVVRHWAVRVEIPSTP